MRLTWVMGALVLGLVGAGKEGVEVRLEGVGEGAVGKYFFSYAQPRTEVSGVRPGTLRVLPVGVKHPVYGVLPVGSRGLGRVFHVVLDADEEGGLRKRLWVDTNGDGDMTNDPPVTKWEEKSEDWKGKKYDWYEGSAKVDIGEAGKPFLANFGMMAVNPANDAGSGIEAKTLVYWRDYGRAGRVTIGDKVYLVGLDDELATGDFTAETKPAKPYEKMRHIFLCVDRNGNGTFDGKGERFSTTRPFSLEGVTYEVKGMTPGGDYFRLVTSKEKVEELPVPLNVEVGKGAPGFDGALMGGGVVHFPGDFKGKLVLLDFWETQCGPCVAEMPNIRAAWERFHGAGLEVVSISENEAKDEQVMRDAVKKLRMDWMQVWDRKGEKSDIFLKYGVGGIPELYLVDGDTGVVLAEDLRGEGLSKRIEEEMRKKGLVRK